MLLAAAGANQAQAGDRWTGLYFGGNLGSTATEVDLKPGFKDDFKIVNDDIDAFYLKTGRASFSSDTFTGGGQLGYAEQFGQMVLGIEADFDFLDADASRHAETVLDATRTLVSDDRVSSDWLLTLRPRVGFVSGSFLGYVTGGLAISNVDFDHSVNLTFNNGGTPVTGQFSESKTLTGWTIGGGAEYALDKNWSIKGEYLYVDLGSIGGSSELTTLSKPVLESSDAEIVHHVGRAGVNYRF